jgi:hypothetical protein
MPLYTNAFIAKFATVSGEYSSVFEDVREALRLFRRRAEMLGLVCAGSHRFVWWFLKFFFNFVGVVVFGYGC